MTLIHLDADRLRSLCIFPSESNRTWFYMFDRSLYIEYWDVISIGQWRDRPPLLEIRFMHIDEELIDGGLPSGRGLGSEPPFNAFNEAPGYMRLTLAELSALTSLLETWIDEPAPNANNPITYFRRMMRQELAQLHVAETNPNIEATWYRYLPDEGVQTTDEITLVRPPLWRIDSRYGVEQHTIVQLASFSQQRLKNPTFDPLDSWGLGHIITNQGGLRELIILLQSSTS